jgi:hypothetical protein
VVAGVEIAADQHRQAGKFRVERLDQPRDLPRPVPGAWRRFRDGWKRRFRLTKHHGMQLPEAAGWRNFQKILRGTPAT